MYYALQKTYHSSKLKFYSVQNYFFLFLSFSLLLSKKQWKQKNWTTSIPSVTKELPITVHFRCSRTKNKNCTLVIHSIDSLWHLHFTNLVRKWNGRLLHPQKISLRKKYISLQYASQSDNCLFKHATSQFNTTMIKNNSYHINATKFPCIVSSVNCDGFIQKKTKKKQKWMFALWSPQAKSNNSRS